MNGNWEKDPRISNMNQEKISFLKKYAKLLSHTQKSDLPSTFLSMNKEAVEKKLHFSNAETELIISVLTSNLSPSEIERFHALRTLMQKTGKAKK